MIHEERAWVAAAFFAALERPAAPLGRTAFLAAVERSVALRLLAAFLAWLDSDFLLTELLPSFLRAFLVARDRFGDGSSLCEPALLSCSALRLVAAMPSWVRLSFLLCLLRA